MLFEKKNYKRKLLRMFFEKKNTKNCCVCLFEKKKKKLLPNANADGDTKRKISKGVFGLKNQICTSQSGTTTTPNPLSSIADM